MTSHPRETTRPPTGPVPGPPAPHRRGSARGRSRRSLAGHDDGMTTAEYAVGTVAACGFGGLLYKLLTSDRVASMLGALLERALSVGF